ncbi:MAG: glycosyltransferase [Bacteroidales bacterium]|nr:glycosyltransferase [Bacteroidales bacterium]
MPGLFIQRQAEALAATNHVVVLYAHPDPDCPSEFEIDYSEENRVITIRVYFKIPDIVLPGIYQAMNLINFYRAHMRGLEIVGDFVPDIIHSHILTREAFIGHRLSRRYRVPHVISEHWSRYFPENGSYKGWGRKMLTRYLVGKADAVIAVSAVLKQAMISSHLPNKHYFVVPNVVDTSKMDVISSGNAHPRKRFLHVSCFDDRAKNISGFLHAISDLSQRRSDFHGSLVGEGPDLERMKKLAMELGLKEEVVSFTGLMGLEDLVTLYGSADFTVLSSRYETFGTVIIESLACGTPVVATRVGIAPEVINDRNGMLIPTQNTPALVDAIDRMLDKSSSFDKNDIRKTIGDQFTPEAVREKLLAIYSQIRGDV